MAGDSTITRLLPEGFLAFAVAFLAVFLAARLPTAFLATLAGAFVGALSVARSEAAVTCTAAIFGCSSSAFTPLSSVISSICSRRSGAPVVIHDEPGGTTGTSDRFAYI